MANGSGENGGTAPGSRTVTRLINTAAANLAACGEGVRESTALIQRSCETPGVHSSLLGSKTGELGRLAEFCDTAAARLMDLGAQVRGDLFREDSLVEMLAECRSIVAQLRNQQREARRILSLLGNGHANTSDHSPEDCRGRQRVRKGGDAHP